MVFADKVPNGFYHKVSSQMRPPSRSTNTASLLQIELSKTMAEAIENAGREPAAPSTEMKTNELTASPTAKTSLVNKRTSQKTVTQVTI